MTESPVLHLDTDRYIADTTTLSTIEHGAYLLIIVAMCRSKDGWLDGSDQFLARVTRLTLGRWKRIGPTIRKFLIEREGKVTQKRVQKDREVIPGGNPIRETKLLKNKGRDPEFLGPAESASCLVLNSDSPDLKKNKRHKGTILPPDWQPADAERLYARTVLKLSESAVNAAAEQMRRWALSNQHRAVARKSNWAMTFRNWLDRYASENPPNMPPRVSPTARANGWAVVKHAMTERRREIADAENAGFETDGPTVPAALSDSSEEGSGNNRGGPVARRNTH